MARPIVIPPGTRFGKLTAIHATRHRTKRGRVLWQCLCDCGATALVQSGLLIYGNTKSCGCLKRDQVRNISGLRFGRLTAIDQTSKRANNGLIVWLCQCDCGQQPEVTSYRLISGRTKSCGCLRREIVTTHGATRNGTATTEYVIWKSIKQRCLNPNDGGFSDYGGRGIGVCERWSNFDAFLADMGPRPKAHSLERRDNSRGYSPDNCYWADRHHQAWNRRSNHMLTLNGETMCIAQWSARTGLPSTAIIGRLKRRWTVEQTLTAPLRSTQA